MQNIKGFEIIEQFLDNWKQCSLQWYANQKIKYEHDKSSFEETYTQMKAEFAKLTPEQIIEKLDAIAESGTDTYGHYWINKEYKNSKIRNINNALVALVYEPYTETFHKKWQHIEKHLHKKTSYEESVEKMLQTEYERKYNRFIADVQGITGDVVKSDIKIGSTQNIEGFIEGSKGKAELWSTFVCGEIQCPHFRFYCHKR